jgi:hypothetical protein
MRWGILSNNVSYRLSKNGGHYPNFMAISMEKKTHDQVWYPVLRQTHLDNHVISCYIMLYHVISSYIMLYHVHDVLRWKGFFQTGRAGCSRRSLQVPWGGRRTFPCLIPKKQIQWFLMICVPNKIVRGYSGLYKYYCIHKCNNTPKSSLVGGAIKI